MEEDSRAGHTYPDTGISPANTHKPSDQKKSFFQKTRKLFSKPKSWMETIALLVVIAYTYQAYRQSISVMQQQLYSYTRHCVSVTKYKPEEISYRNDSRPSVWFTAELVNSGGTPASVTISAAVIDLGVGNRSA